MKTVLTANLSVEEVKELRASFQAGYVARQRLKKLLEKKIESLCTSMEAEDILTTPNWELIQVDRIAQIKSCRYMISILED